jgi:hypothetical protein
VVLAAALIGSVLVRSGGAITFLDVQYGTPTGSAMGRSAALGSTGVSQHHGAESIVHNPALLALETDRVRLDFSFALMQASEDRLVPLFDSFNSFVDETTIAVNRNTYAQAQGGLSWRMPVDNPMTLSIGVFDRFDFNFDYFEEVRDPNPFSDPRDALLQNRTFATDGILRSLTAAYGAEIAPRANVGVSVHRYFGEVTYERAVTYVQDDSSRTEQIVRDLTGWGVTLGAHARPHERLDVGVAFEVPFTVSGDHRTGSTSSGTPGAGTVETSTDAEIQYPGALTFGVTYLPRNVLTTTFSVEFVRRFWEGLEDTFLDATGDQLGLRDTWDFRVGLEHVFYNELPLRFGFRYLENYADVESERSIYSVGLGYRIGELRLDVTGLYHRQTSRQEFLFDPTLVVDGTTFPSPNSDTKVEDSILQLVFGLSRSF